MASNPHVRTFYKLLQCIHHQNIINDQINGNWSKAFKNKNRQLNDFIKPVFPTEIVKNEIKSINLNWTLQILETLNTHYTDSATKLKMEIEAIPQNIKQDSLEKAISRAKKNFGKKLKPDTIQKLNEMSKSAQPKNKHTPQKQIKTNKSPLLPTPISPKTQNLHQKPKQPLLPTPNSPNLQKKTPTPKTSKAPNIIPTYSEILKSPPPPKPAKTKVTTKTPVKNPAPQIQHLTRSCKKFKSQTQQTNQTLPGKQTVHTPTKFKNKDWKMDSITHETLIIGDSNLKHITSLKDNIQIESYPGAKINHITNIITKYPNKFCP